MSMLGLGVGIDYSLFIVSRFRERLRAQRPVDVAIADDMLQVCPDALLLNYTNPMAMVPWGVYAGTAFRNVFGVCHSVRDTHAFLAGTVGVPEEQIRPEKFSGY